MDADAHTPRDDLDDEALVDAARVEPTAFSPLYQRYVRQVYRYCFGKLGSHELAEDATSQVFVQAMTALPRYRAASFRGWLFTIAHNIVVDLQRRRPTASWDEARELRDPERSPEEAAITTDGEDVVIRLLALLSRDQRDVVQLRLAGLTTAEIAAVLGRRQGAIRATQFRAFQTLRAALAEEDLSHES